MNPYPTSQRANGIRLGDGTQQSNRTRTTTYNVSGVMTCCMAAVFALATVGPLTPHAEAAVVCQRKGKVKLRATTCKKKETLVGTVSTSSDTEELAARLAALEALLAPVSLVDSGAVLRFTGVNVQIVSGSGLTGGTPNGLGNLIVGYDEAVPGRCASVQDFPDVCLADADCPNVGTPNPCEFPMKTGSHNLVVGAGHSYSSWGGLVAGDSNAISAAHASVSGGVHCTASGVGSSISGGMFNTASGIVSSISGGTINTADGQDSSVLGGRVNQANGQGSVVVGGQGNVASATDEIVP